VSCLLYTTDHDPRPSSSSQRMAAWMDGSVHAMRMRWMFHSNSKRYYTVLYGITVLLYKLPSAWYDCITVGLDDTMPVYDYDGNFFRKMGNFIGKMGEMFFYPHHTCSISIWYRHSSRAVLNRTLHCIWFLFPHWKTYHHPQIQTQSRSRTYPALLVQAKRLCGEKRGFVSGERVGCRWEPTTKGR
jgi:hypothetical protein